MSAHIILPVGFGGIQEPVTLNREQIQTPHHVDSIIECLTEIQQLQAGNLLEVIEERESLNTPHISQSNMPPATGGAREENHERMTENLNRIIKYIDQTFRNLFINPVTHKIINPNINPLAQSSLTTLQTFLEEFNSAENLERLRVVFRHNNLGEMGLRHIPQRLAVSLRLNKDSARYERVANLTKNMSLTLQGYLQN